MITRLMLNLRDPALAHMAGRRTQSTTLSGNVRFAPYLGATAPELDTDAVMGACGLWAIQPQLS